MRALPIALASALVITVPLVSAPAPPAAGSSPTIDDLISLKRVTGSPAISPDGRFVAYTVRETNWDDDRYETEIWLADVAAGTTRQLTNAPKSSGAPAWSPDGRRIAFSSDRSDKRQIYLIDPAGGEAVKLTSSEDGVGGFRWSPDGASIAFTAVDPQTDALKTREKTFGQFDVIGQEHRMSHLYVIDVASKAVRRLTTGDFTVGSFSWSPDGRSIAFDHRINSDNANGGTANISVVSVAGGAVRAIVTQDGPDTNPIWSPDGSRIAFESKMANPSYFYTNTVIAVVPAAGGSIEPLSSAFDEDPSIEAWKASGLFFSASQRTSSYLYRLDPATKAVRKIAPADGWIGQGFSLSATGDVAAFAGSNATHFPEVYVSGPGATPARALTNLGAQVAAWAQPAREVITWKSQDGATIEGVLHKPAGFQAGKRYPLLVVIHGGPTGVSRPVPFQSTSTYPIDVWLGRGVLVLEPNYRGSAGYGEKFRALNVRNLGVGDAWDVLSGIDALIGQGLVDPNEVGAMGWSQGGYISAYLTTHDSARFKAISVGAGISDWMTYYVSTDITPFTIQYLKATPWDDPAIYAKTSPMTYIKGARTPTLIQHGATDQRVPPPDAFELYRGLLDQHVPTKLVIYRGFEGVGHGPSKPKSSRAVMTHNLEWFDQYFFTDQKAGRRQAPSPRP
ncbi:MAG TPA: S9 family peptidase [Vicinamibacterales bacterium]|nr:S9 family peptidase [Vicinamibacterales bacterium]